VFGNVVKHGLPNMFQQEHLFKLSTFGFLMEVMSALFTPAMLILMNLKLISYRSILDITDVLESKLIVILSKLHGEVTVFHPGREDPQNPDQNKLN